MFKLLNTPPDIELAETPAVDRVELSTGMHWDGTPEGAYLLVPYSVNFNVDCAAAPDFRSMPVLRMVTGEWVELGSILDNPKIKPAGVEHPSMRIGTHDWETPLSSLGSCTTLTGHDRIADAVLERNQAMCFHWTRGSVYMELYRLVIGFPALEYQQWLKDFVAKHASYREEDIFSEDFYAHTDHSLVPKRSGDWYIFDFNRVAARKGAAFVTIGDGHYSDNGVRAAPLYHDRKDAFKAFSNAPAFTVCDLVEGTFNGTDAD